MTYECWKLWSKRNSFLRKPFSYIFFWPFIFLNRCHITIRYTIRCKDYRLKLVTNFPVGSNFALIFWLQVSFKFLIWFNLCIWKWWHLSLTINTSMVLTYTVLSNKKKIQSIHPHDLRACVYVYVWFEWICDDHSAWKFF